jgi:hypothetical protein
MANSAPYPTSNAGLREHWQSVGAKLEAIHREEVRQHGVEAYPDGIVDSLLQLGYLHGNRERTTGLIDWQRRLFEAYARRREFSS